MCGRAYHTYSDEELEMRYRRHRPIRFESIEKSYNFAPTQMLPVLIETSEGKTEFSLMRWGLIPSWAKDEKFSFSTINARAETIDSKPMFRNAFQKRRCIVPISGFFEWRKEGTKKTPYRIFSKDSPILSLAGIWESWKKADGEVIDSFSIITTEANATMKPIHDRMPVLLSEEDEAQWLHPESSPTTLKKLLKPCPPSWLVTQAVSTLVNSPRNNRPEILEPTDSA